MVASTLIHYADDIVLIADTLEELQHHVDALVGLCAWRGLSVNLGKTMVTIFLSSRKR